MPPGHPEPAPPAFTDASAPDAPPRQRLDTTAAAPYAKQEYLRRALWELVQATLIRYSPRRAYRWRCWWLRRFGATLGHGARTRPKTRVVFPWLLTLGDYASIADDVDLYNLGPITIGEHTVVSQGAYLCAGTHDYNLPDLPLIRATIDIGPGVWVCAQAFVGPGVHIGEGCVVGARAVVTGDLPPHVVAGGNPAQPLKPRAMQRSPA